MKAYAQYGKAPGPFFTQEVPVKTGSLIKANSADTSNFLVLIESRWRLIRIHYQETYCLVKGERVNLTLALD